MAKQQKRLGRGLSSLISVGDEQPARAPESPVSVAEPSGEPLAIELSRIRPNPFQPRKEMDPEELSALSQSIRNAGLVQPIVVRRLGDDGFEIIAGERRWKAANMAGLEKVPAIVREASDEEMLEIALIENIFREDLNAIDRAKAYRRYCDEFGLNAEQVAARLGEDRTTVTNYMRLLDLPQEVKDWVASGTLSMGHARCLLAIRSATDLVRTAKQSINLGLSVRALEKLVRDRVDARDSATKPPEQVTDTKRAQIRRLEELFKQALGMKVEIQESRRKGSGKITIYYPDLESFDRVAERLGVDVDA